MVNTNSGQNRSWDYYLLPLATLCKNGFENMYEHLLPRAKQLDYWNGAAKVRKHAKRKFHSLRNINASHRRFLENLVENINERFEKKDIMKAFGKEHVVDQGKMKDEWPMVKEFMSTSYRECLFQDDWTIMLQNETLSPNVSTLVKIALMIPINTADCERGFSRYNLIKTKVMSVQSAH